MSRIRTIRDLAPERLAGARVVMRVDLNVPVADGAVQDDTRIEAVLPSLQFLTGRGARVLLLSHFGRPRNGPSPEFSLEPVARRLEQLLGADVRFTPHVRGSDLKDAAAALPEGGVLVVENTRFDPGETANDPELAAEWAALADVYVNDAFGAAHRAHASTHAVAGAARQAGHDAVAGLLMERELRFLDSALADPERPFVAILGGAKISGKIDVVEALLQRVDRLLIGGAMANTFFLALGLGVGRSLVEEDRVDMAEQMLDLGADRLLLPVDCVVADEIAADASTRVVARTDVGGDDRIGDIGPESLALFRAEIAGARTVVWNGPMGVFELPPFASGTFGVAAAVAEATDGGALSVVGGGDSAAAAEAAGLADRFSHVSTGGGASLELLAGKELPGLQVLSTQEEV